MEIIKLVDDLTYEILNSKRKSVGINYFTLFMDFDINKLVNYLDNYPHNNYLLMCALKYLDLYINKNNFFIYHNNFTIIPAFYLHGKTHYDKLNKNFSHFQILSKAETDIAFININSSYSVRIANDKKELIMDKKRYTYDLNKHVYGYTKSGIINLFADSYPKICCNFDNNNYSNVEEVISNKYATRMFEIIKNKRIITHKALASEMHISPSLLTNVAKEYSSSGLYDYFYLKKTKYYIVHNYFKENN